MIMINKTAIATAFPQGKPGAKPSIKGLRQLSLQAFQQAERPFSLSVYKEGAERRARRSGKPATS